MLRNDEPRRIPSVKLPRALDRDALFTNRVGLHVTDTVQDHREPISGVIGRPPRQLGVFGFPVRANAIHASLLSSAKAIASAPPPVTREEICTLSKTNGISDECGDFK